MKLDIEKLVYIDRILDKLQSERREDISIEFCRVISQAIGIEYEDLKDLFNEKLEFEEKRFIAICLLRLLNVDDTLFQKVDFRVKAFKLFDEVFPCDIYKHLKIDVKDQSFEKESKLKGVVYKVEDELSSLIDSFNNLSSLNDFRSKFMQLINNQLAKAIIWPFLPRHLLNFPLKEVFKSVESYLSEEGAQILIAYERTKESLKLYISEASQFGTRYCCEFLEKPVNKLLHLVEAHFQASPASKPAKLVVEKFDKKYPFHVVDEEINLVFLVKNIGSGYAFDAEIEVVDATASILKPKHYLGQIEPESSIEILIPCKIESAEDLVMVEIKITYASYNGTQSKEEFCFGLECQRRDIEWDNLIKERPYSLEPVTSENEFAGRAEILNKLESLITAESGVGSAFIYGQKRVGKTSIVKILKKRLEQKYTHDFLVVYLEGGDYIHPNPETTIENLGRKLVKSIQNLDARFASLDIPDFKGALSPITDFLESVVQIAPELKIVFILDEFDELPMELYKRTPIGDAFFLTLRSISGKPPFGFILVGGEKMEFIMSCQGDALNKFEPIRVDYFDKEQHWADFQDLVQKPVKEWLEISDEALSALYEQTAGNPFFTKLICRDLFEIMVKRRDCYVTYREVNEAAEKALRSVASNIFQHFWEDGIVGTGPEVEEKSVLRRKLLLAFAEVLRESKMVTEEEIENKCRKWGILDDLVENELREFERRQVLITSNDTYNCKVRFFEKWLVEKGFNEIITTLVDHDVLARRKQEEERVRVTSEEIIHLIRQWGPYKGRLITEDKVRAWLNQFGDNKKQRLMFKILQGVKFYSGDVIRSKLREAHGIVRRGLIHRTRERQRKRSDILVSYLDCPGKSGSYLAKIYADENRIYYENVIEKSKITEKLKEKASEFSALALAFVDDFIGTGDSACEYFKRLAEKHGEILRELSNKPGEIKSTSKLNIYFVAICGFQESQAKIEETLRLLNLPVKIHICDPLTEASKAFGDCSEIFPDEREREEAKKIAYEFGVKLVKNAPLGYGNCQATVIFEHTCPNNDLPILWQKAKDFIPIFPRR